jgi:hypothetical protein
MNHYTPSDPVHQAQLSTSAQPSSLPIQPVFDMHTMGNVFLCQNCNASFSAQQSLDNHIIQYHTGGSHRCHLCNKSYRELISLRNHITRKHPQPTSTNNKAFNSHNQTMHEAHNTHSFATQAPPIYDPFSSELFIAKTKQIMPAPSHTHIIHKQDTLFYTRQPCSQCTAVFSSVQDLDTHRSIYHRPYEHTCYLCGEQCCFPGPLMQHILGVHSNKNS